MARPASPRPEAEAWKRDLDSDIERRLAEIDREIERLRTRGEGRPQD